MPRIAHPSLKGGLIKKVPRFSNPLSRHLNGMLNAAAGGSFFLGVTDDGRAEGFMMSAYQRVSMS